MIGAAQRPPLTVQLAPARRERVNIIAIGLRELMYVETHIALENQFPFRWPLETHVCFPALIRAQMRSAAHAASTISPVASWKRLPF
jgi:hypothetical protein